jgi:hypothetical protein
MSGRIQDAGFGLPGIPIPPSWVSKTKVLEEDRSFYRGDYAISV